MTSFQRALSAFFTLALATTVAAQAPAATPKPASKPEAEKSESKTAKEKEQPAADEHHHALSVHHMNAAEHAKALHHDAMTHAALSKDVAKEHVEEMGRSLEAAKRHHAAIKQVTGDDAKLKAHHDAIEAHHAAAAEHHAALKAELDKPSPDSKTVAEHAAGMHHAMTQAEAEHKHMMTKRKVSTPKVPPVPKAAAAAKTAAK